MSFELGLVKLVGSEWYGEGRMVQIWCKRGKTQRFSRHREETCVAGLVGLCREGVRDRV